MNKGSDATQDAWQVMDDWCARQGQKLLDRSNEQINAGVKLSDPEYRCLLGQSQAFGRMRSFIHQARALTKVEDTE